MQNERSFDKTQVDQSKNVFKSDSRPNLNFETPDAINLSLKNKTVTVQLSNGRIESGKLTHVGQYFVEITMANGKPLIINKAQIITVAVIP